MATFKVGQRVRKVAHRGPWNVPIGAEGTIISPSDVPGDWLVNYDGYPYTGKQRRGAWSQAPYMLAPLTDPGADEFIENMERFSRVTRRVPSPVQ